MKNKNYKTIAEYANILNVTTQSIYARAKSGTIEFELLGKIKVIDIDKFQPIMLPAGRKKAVSI